MAEILPPVKKLIVSSARKDLSSKTPKILRKFVLRLQTVSGEENRSISGTVGFELMTTTEGVTSVCFPRPRLYLLHRTTGTENNDLREW